MKPSLQQLFDTQTVLIDLPDFLVNFRKAKRITQKELADELELTPGAISADENGGYNHASLLRLLQVINALVRISHRKNIT